MKCGDDGFFMPHFMQIMTTKSTVGGIVVARRRQSSVMPPKYVSK